MAVAEAPGLPSTAAHRAAGRRIDHEARQQETADATCAPVLVVFDELISLLYKGPPVCVVEPSVCLAWEQADEEGTCLLGRSRAYSHDFRL